MAKRILLLLVIVLAILLGYSFGRSFGPFDKSSTLRLRPDGLRVFDSLRSLRVNQSENHIGFKKAILRIGLVADSHNENELLAKALKQAQGKGINFVIGLGDYTNLGTIDELMAAKTKFDESRLEYFAVAGDRDGWESRKMGNVDYFEQVFGRSTQIIDREGIRFVILDNSDIYRGIAPEDWRLLEEVTKVSNVLKVSNGETNSTSDTFVTSETFDTSAQPKLRFVFAHKTPFHPDSKHVMGEDSLEVAEQAKKLIKLIEDARVVGFFSGDMHFFAKFNSPLGSVKITTVGAVAAERNFQGPRFAILTVFDDYSWEVEDVEIR